jgi:hypothetical protein
MSDFVKLVVFVPVTHADEVRRVLAEAGAGKFGHYDACSFSSRGIGRFRPLKGSNPAVGTEGVLQEVEEERIEVLCSRAMLRDVITAVKKAHPYEEPAIDILPLEQLP